MEGSRRVELDRRLQISPYTVYRRLAAGERILLVDLGSGGAASRPPALRDALERPGPGWRPPEGVPVVLFDQDGSKALELARRLVGSGHAEVKALFGGLDLWDLALGGVEEEKSDTSDTSDS